MKQKGVIGVLIIVLVLITGCSSVKNDEKEPKPISISDALDEVMTVEVYSEGKCSELLTTSEEFKQLESIIEKNESKLNLIDGGWTIDMKDSIDYAKYSLDKECKTYIINFKEPLYLNYSNYASSGNTVIGMFLIPEQGYIGAIYKVDAESKIDYATLMNAEEDIFSEVK